MKHVERFLKTLSDEDKSHLMDLLHESMESKDEEEKEHEEGESEEEEEARPNFKKMHYKGSKE